MEGVSFYLSFPLLEREYGKVEGGDKSKRMDMCDDLWNDWRKTSLWFIYTPVLTVSWLRERYIS